MTDPLQMLGPETLDHAGLEVINPSNGMRVASVRLYDIAALTEIIERAEAARHEWSARTAKERSDVLRAWYNLICESSEGLARLMTLESGKPLDESRGEVKYGAAFIEWFSEEARRAYGEVIPTHATGKRIITLRQPVGTCAAITSKTRAPRETGSPGRAPRPMPACATRIQRAPSIASDQHTATSAYTVDAGVARRAPGVLGPPALRQTRKRSRAWTRRPSTCRCAGS